MATTTCASGRRRCWRSPHSWRSRWSWRPCTMVTTASVPAPPERGAGAGRARQFPARAGPSRRGLGRRRWAGVARPGHRAGQRRTPPRWPVDHATPPSPPRRSARSSRPGQLAASGHASSPTAAPEAVDRARRGHLLVEGARLGDHDRGPSGGGDLGHGVLAAVGDHDVGGRQVGPQVGRGRAGSALDPVPARGGGPGGRDLRGRACRARRRPTGAGRVVPLPRRLSGSRNGRRGAHRSRPRARSPRRRPGRPPAVEARQRPDAPRASPATTAGQSSVCAPRATARAARRRGRRRGGGPVGAHARHGQHDDGHAAEPAQHARPRRTRRRRRARAAARGDPPGDCGHAVRQPGVVPRGPVQHVVRGGVGDGRPPAASGRRARAGPTPGQPSGGGQRS